MKKISVVFALLCFAFMLFAADFVDINFEAEIQIKQTALNPNMFAWRDVLYVDTEIEIGSEQDYKIRATDVKKGYSNFELMQINGSSVKVDPKGKETAFKPGKIFKADGGLIWISFTAPDKKNYKLPTALKLVPKKADAPSEKKDVAKAPVKETVVYKSTEPEIEIPSYNELYFVRDEYSYPTNGDPECEYVDVLKQFPDKNAYSNEQVVVKNLPDGTKSRLFLLDNNEVLVFLAPDLTLRSGSNSYTLFYSTRKIAKAGKEEAFSAPKRIVDNPKVNGKFCNVAEFTGDVFVGGGKKKELVIVWTQFTKQNDDGVKAEDLCRTTAIYSSSMVDDGNLKWSKAPAVVSEVSGTLQFTPEIYNSGKTLQLRVTNRMDNSSYSQEINPAFPIKYNYYYYDKGGKWKGSDKNEFVSVREAYPFTDKNSVIPADFEYVFDKEQNLRGVVYSSQYVDEDDGETYTDCFAKSYVKSPEGKQMIWTESVPVIYHNKADNVLYPHAVARPTGEWLVTYLNETEEDGNNICVARVNVEPCLVTKTMVPNLDDMEHPNGTVRFVVEVRNQGLGIAEGCDVILRNEFNTEAGKVTTKNPVYPGTTYFLPGAYSKLRGKDGVVPVEKVRGEAKPLKIKNSNFAINKATFTMGIPHFKIGDIFVKTKGFAQTLYMAIGTSNGVKVKAPGVELVLTEHIESDDYEDNIEIIPVDYDLSDDYRLIEYAYLTGDFQEKSFTVLPHLHFTEKSEHLPQYSKDEIEEMTACSSQIDILNPLYTKGSVTGGLTGSTFTKKTKVMEAEFVVTNNWAEAVDGEAVLELFNTATNKVEKTMTVPFSLDVMNSKKVKCAFDPASSDVAADYKVNFRLK